MLAYMAYMDPMGMGEAQKLPGFDTINIYKY